MTVEEKAKKSDWRLIIMFGIFAAAMIGDAIVDRYAELDRLKHFTEQMEKLCLDSKSDN